MTPEKLTDERDAFEAWAHADNRDVAPEWNEERTPDNGLYYISQSTNDAYIGWRERGKHDATAAERTRADTLEDVVKIASDQIDDMLGAIRDGIKRAEAAEERVKALTVERDALRDALLHVIRADNGCTPQPPDPAGCTGWNANECDCAIEARDMIAPPAGGEKL